MISRIVFTCQRREFIHPSGARLAVDTVSYNYIKGSVVDFEESLVRTGFVVTKNPNAAESCSCGTSFTAKTSNPYDFFICYTNNNYYYERIFSMVGRTTALSSA